jgi:mannose-6-phosphate isomerase-like protein (cupin superfamily)/predicted heme/steroid binding protein
MYNPYNTYPCQNFFNAPRHTSNIKYNACEAYQCPYCVNAPRFTEQYIPFADEIDYDSRFNFPQSANDDLIELKDYGPEPFVVNINEATKQNDTYRTALWTGSHLQVTLMSLKVGEDIGLEIHPNLDQFIRIEQGEGIVKMGDRKDRLDFQERVYDDFAFVIPAGKWHNLINTGNEPLKLYSIYAPPQHPRGTVHVTKSDAQAAEEHRGDYRQKKQKNSRQTKEFTLSELAQYDGTMGKPAYVAVNGIVYDVSANSKWSGAVHYGLTAGKDLSSQFENCHSSASKLAKLPKVGVLKG